MKTAIVIAALTVALPNGFFMNWFGNQKGEGFEYHILMAAIALAVMIQGGGKWALDSLIYRKFVGGGETSAVATDARKQPAIA